MFADRLVPREVTVGVRSLPSGVSVAWEVSDTAVVCVRVSVSVQSSEQAGTRQETDYISVLSSLLCCLWSDKWPLRRVS
jgi:hypothetical protein